MNWKNIPFITRHSTAIEKFKIYHKRFMMLSENRTMYSHGEIDEAYRLQCEAYQETLKIFNQELWKQWLLGIILAVVALTIPYFK